MNFLKKGPKLSSNIGIKCFFMALLILVLLIPSAWVQELIDERSDTREDTIQEVSDKWGLEQNIYGPVLNLPLTVNINGKSGNQVAHFLPESLYISGDLTPEVRSRGIYEVPLYTADLNISGVFPKIDLDTIDANIITTHWEDATLSLGVTDMRGITEEVTLSWNEQTSSFEPGLDSSDLFDNGVRDQVSISEETNFYSYAIDLKVNGSTDIAFSPLGKETVVKLESSWLNPSFDGAFLPDDHSIDESGFSAEWKVINLNRNFPQQWLGSASSISGYDFGVELYQPVDIYQKTERSAKYMILFIALTFAAFFFIEVINEKRFHPIQYLLVGLALIVFYLLLLSLAEHTGFDLAYLAGSIGTVGLITLYARSLFRDKKLTAILMGLLILLYLFLYILLQLVDYALLMGSIGLFFILGGIMFTTRNIDWYGGKEIKE